MTHGWNKYATAGIYKYFYQIFQVDIFIFRRDSEHSIPENLIRRDLNEHSKQHNILIIYFYRTPEQGSGVVDHHIYKLLVRGIRELDKFHVPEGHAYLLKVFLPR